jgi:hypothetical protein
MLGYILLLARRLTTKVQVKKVKTFLNFNPVYYQICTFFAPCLELFLHFVINHKIDNQYITIQKHPKPEILWKLLPFARPA